MAFTLVFLLDPIPLFSKTSRYWLLRLSARLLASGTRRVEFADFWLGDQFCSLVYTLTSMYFIACAATVDGGWTNAIPRCETRNNRHWPLLFFLASLPSIVRAVQCVRRWVDEGKRMHLVNVWGKYLSSMVMYLFYFWWRFHGAARNGYMAVWMLSATIASLYTTYWDLVMDWSVFSQSWPPEWLKREVIYRNHIWVRQSFFAIINVILRFAWTIYIPARGPSAPLRGFIAGCLEALRRVQWNMIRLENEQVGNADQFRVTREVPLPYRFNPEDDSEDEPLSHDSKLRRRKQQRARDSVVRLSGLQAMEEGDHSEPDGTEQHQAGS
ncbi:EXS-domain-containing protein [Auriculariales sp. MPI-PUGE-AT-0066]|nr:EXS-domain-containing protein [Auriculariales sp. MPI-PUGE-AT-0066]